MAALQNLKHMEQPDWNVKTLVLCLDPFYSAVRLSSAFFGTCLHGASIIFMLKTMKSLSHRSVILVFFRLSPLGQCWKVVQSQNPIIYIERRGDLANVV